LIGREEGSVRIVDNLSHRELTIADNATPVGSRWIIIVNGLIIALGNITTNYS
jgi:hypothetical protein